MSRSKLFKYILCSILGLYFIEYRLYFAILMLAMDYLIFGQINDMVIVQKDKAICLETCDLVLPSILP